MDDAPEFLTVREVANKLRVSQLTVIRMINAGKLAAIRPGRSYRITVASYKAWLTDQTDQAA